MGLGKKIADPSTGVDLPLRYSHSFHGLHVLQALVALPFLTFSIMAKAVCRLHSQLNEVVHDISRVAMAWLRLATSFLIRVLRRYWSTRWYCGGEFSFLLIRTNSRMISIGFLPASALTNLVSQTQARREYLRLVPGHREGLTPQACTLERCSWWQDRSRYGLNWADPHIISPTF